MKQHKRQIALALSLIVVLIVLGAGYWYFFLYGQESTEDAYVHADIARVSSRIPGNIQKIYIDNNDYVKKGELLLTLDPSDLLAQKKILLASKKQILAQLEGEKTRLRFTDERTLAAIEAAEANLKTAQLVKEQTLKQIASLKDKREELIITFQQAQKDLKRYKQLWLKKLIALRTLENVQNQVKVLASKLKSIDNQIKADYKIKDQAESKIQAAQAILRQNKALRKEVAMVKSKIKALHAALEEVKARLDQIDLNLSYTQIKAPMSGYIAQKNIQVGERVMPGASLLAIVPLHKVYVVANFKETQLTHMYLGQPAIIVPDIYPNLKLKGKVVGIGAGTGSVFSLLPPENAVGNWIKVVQRVPVKIQFTQPLPQKYPLLVGLSVEVTVNTKTKTENNLFKLKPAYH
ncbi:MAG: HlyD family secretion protein [Desulfonauticus sp.]|nr:HlyD family secretion protein [Desulfonauticus sp.]